jgi:hypothetical protein
VVRKQFTRAKRACISKLFPTRLAKAATRGAISSYAKPILECLREEIPRAIAGRSHTIFNSNWAGRSKEEREKNVNIRMDVLITPIEEYYHQREDKAQNSLIRYL